MATVNNVDIKDALLDSYHDSVDSLAIIEKFFIEFTSKNFSVEEKRIFFRNWRSPGPGSASFCALTFRILELCNQETNQKIKTQLFYSAMQISKIAYEDVGIGGINHQELYENFAFKFSGNDEWKLNKYQIPNLKLFLTDARKYRQNGDDIKHAITLSISEELYNHAEFSFISPLFINWHTNITKFPIENIQDDLKFIFDHLGTTEIHHFAAAVNSLENYCTASNLEIDGSSMYKYNKGFIDNMALYYKKLMLFIVELNYHIN